MMVALNIVLQMMHMNHVAQPQVKRVACFSDEKFLKLVFFSSVQT